MQIYDCVQGSDEWRRIRAGAITASMFSTIRDTYKTGKNKGGYKQAALDYAFRLAVERISGTPLDEGFEPWAARRGRELEPEARNAHAFISDLDIEQCGFVATDDRKFGCSADGLINDDGGSEYKCFVDPAKLRAIVVDKALDEYTDQVQGGMWLTGRVWWDFCLYCPALADVGKDLIVHRIYRDETHIEQMESDLWEFDKLVCAYVGQLKQEAA